MTLIVFAILLSLLQNGLAQYPGQYIQLPEVIERGQIVGAPAYVPEIPTTHLKFPAPTTIITDCTPSVCHNLGNLVQLMIVSNLLQNTNIGSTAALKMALPIIREALSSPSLANICPDSLKRQLNLISSRIPDTTNIVQNPVPNIATPNLVVSPNLFISNNLPRNVPNSNNIPDMIYQNLPLPVNSLFNLPVNTILQNLPFNIFESSAVKNSPSPNIIYQNIPLAANAVPNNLPLNRALQNLPLDIFETRAIASTLPSNVIYQNLPLHVSTLSNDVALNTFLKNIPADLPLRNFQVLPAELVSKNSLYERSPNFIFQNTPVDNINTISSLLSTISSSNTKPVIKYIIRS